MYKSRIIISTVIAVALVFSGIQCLATSTGTVNTETVNLRAKTSTESDIVALVSQDEKVEILEKEEDWYKVKYKEKTGYIYAKYVTVKEEKSEEDTKKEETKTEEKEENTTKTTEETVETNTESTKSNVIAEGTKVVIKEDISIRLVPLINSKNVIAVKANAEVTIKEYVNGWYYIVSGNTEGWVREEKISKDNATKEEAKTEENKEEDKKEENEETKTTTKYVSAERVNIREKASTDSEVLKSIIKNTKVTVISTSDGWSKVKVGDTEGYISSQHLSDEKVSEENTNTTNTTNRSSEATRTASSGQSSDVVSYAKTFLGKAYQSGAAGPNTFDCSGFTQYVYKNYGVSLAHSATAQSSVGTAVDRSNLQEGDLVIFRDGSNSSIGHVGIYVGGNQFIHASSPGDTVKITSMSMSYYANRYVTARRVL